MIYLIGFFESLSAFWMGLVYVLNVPSKFVFFTLHTIMIANIYQNKNKKEKKTVRCVHKVLKNPTKYSIPHRLYLKYRRKVNTKHSHWHQLYDAQPFFCFVAKLLFFPLLFFDEAFHSCQMSLSTFISSKCCVCSMLAIC